MPKRLVICCDGTWNDEEDNTNVFKASKTVLDGRTPGGDQKIFYENGVGTAFGEFLKGGIARYGLCPSASATLIASWCATYR